MMKRLIAGAVLALSLAFPALAFFGPSLDYAKSPQEIVKAVQALDGKIGAVVYEDNELSIEYVCPITRNPLVSQAEAVKDIVAKAATAKGADQLEGVGVYLVEPVVYKDGSKGTELSLELYWNMATLKEINWKTVQDWQFLGLVDGVDQGPHGADALQKYCGERHKTAEAFCRAAGAW